MHIIDIYTFPSKATRHIDLGTQHKKWALPPSDSTEKRKRFGRAKKMPVGAFGLFYDESRKSLTAPFVVGSEVSYDDVIADIWPGRWHLPFTILPLGTVEKHILTRQLSSLLSALKLTQIRWSDLFVFRGLTVFSPTHIPFSDWQLLLTELAP